MIAVFWLVFQYKKVVEVRWLDKLFCLKGKSSQLEDDTVSDGYPMQLMPQVNATR